MEFNTAQLAAAIIGLRDPQYSDVRFANYPTSSSLARALMLELERINNRKVVPAPSPTFSEAEIADALKNYGYDQTFGASLARYVAEYIEKARERAKEPEWKPGDVIKSAKGKVLVRTQVGSWYRAADSKYFDDKRVVRPVTVLHKGA